MANLIIRIVPGHSSLQSCAAQFVSFDLLHSAGGSPYFDMTLVQYPQLCLYVFYLLLSLYRHQPESAEIVTQIRRMFLEHFLGSIYNSRPDVCLLVT